MLSRRQAGYLFILLMCVSMSIVMSLAMTIVNRGIGEGLLRAWGRSAAIAFMVALPTALVIVPPIRRFVDRLTR
jgi:hypothetical protein